MKKVLQPSCSSRTCWIQPHSPPLPRKPEISDNLYISCEETDPDRDMSPRPAAFTALVPPHTTCNPHHLPLISCHAASGSIISPILLTPDRYNWLFRQHFLNAPDRPFMDDLCALLSRYHPKSKHAICGSRKYNPSNQWCLPPPLRRALSNCFSSTTELFASPLNCHMQENVTYCSAFPQDTQFGAAYNAFDYRWTGSCLANPEYEPEDMRQTLRHAIASTELSSTPTLIALLLPAWEDSPWRTNGIRSHPNVETVLRLEKGQLKYVPPDRQLDNQVAVDRLTPASWPVELVVVANREGRDQFLSPSKLQTILVPAIRQNCCIPDQHITLFPGSGAAPHSPAPTADISLPPFPVPALSPARTTSSNPLPQGIHHSPITGLLPPSPLWVQHPCLN